MGAAPCHPVVVGQQAVIEHVRPLLEERAEGQEGEAEEAHGAHGGDAEAEREVVAEHGQEVMYGNGADERDDQLHDAAAPEDSAALWRPRSGPADS